MLRRILVAAFAVLGIGIMTSQSSAACAWILWSRSIHTLPGKEPIKVVWEPRAFETRKECEAVRSAWFNRKREPDETAEGKTDEIQIIRSEGQVILLNLKCLPDTIKPEGYDE